MHIEQKYEDLIQKYVPMYPGIRTHCIGVAEIAFEIAQIIKEKNPELNIDPEKIKAACLLHDIGKCKEGDHELNTYEILKKENLPEIAEIVIHGLLYEKNMLKGIENKEYLPNSIENKILVYSDFRFNQKRVSVSERFKELKERNKNKKEYIKALELAEPRLLKIEAEIRRLI